MPREYGARKGRHGMLRLADGAIDHPLSGLDRRQQVVQSRECRPILRLRIGRPRGRWGLFAFGGIHDISAGLLDAPGA
jgi:hypothetical protein